MIGAWQEKIRTWIWNEQPLSLTWLPVRWLCRLLLALLSDLQKAEISLRGMSLVYTTILSLVPMLAFSFSLLKAFGVHDRLAPVLEHFLAPIGAQAGVLTGQILGFVNNLDVRLLGFVGLILLIYTMLRLMYKVQKSLDHCWEVKDSPNLIKRIADYLTLGLLGPLLMMSLATAAAGFNNSVLETGVLQIGVVSALYTWLLSGLPFILIAIGLSFIYWFMPNCEVKLFAAIIAGVIAAFFWKGTGMLFTSFVATSSQYNIYAGFASALLFIIWLYLSWLIFLFGARLAFYSQYPEQMRPEARQLIRGGRALENAGLSVLAEIAQRHYDQVSAPSMEQLAKSLRLSRQTLHALLQTFENDGLLVRSNADIPRYLPAVPFEEVSVARAISAVRHMDAVTVLPMSGAVSSLSERLDAVIDEKFADVAIKSLVDQSSAKD